MPPLLRVLVGCAVLLLPIAASAEIGWQVSKKQGRAYLQASSGEVEVDKEFWAHCRADGSIEVGVGANTSVGEGNGEPVTVTFASAGTMTTLAGNSRKSADFQMTTGTELRTKITRDDTLFKVLTAEKSIAVSGSIKSATWPVTGLKAKVAAFLQACK